MENRLKGTVMPLASVFPAEEAQKAAKHVQDTIVDQQKELGHLHNFIMDNNNLVNLVGRLPDELSHDVMVPFGKAAFFPGRLMHTNEFLVLLGEGYYVERTSKQTIEILQRRGKVLQAQVDSLKATIEDLKTEASFFDATAVEAAEGLVEIMEEYTEESFPEETYNQSGLLKPVGFSAAENVRGATKDEEYARVMARLDELEKEELAAETDEDEAETDFTSSMNHYSFDHHLSDELQPKDVQRSKDINTLNITTGKPLRKNNPEQDFVNQSSIEDLKVPLVPKDAEMPNPVEKSSLSPGSSEKVGAANTSKTEVTKDNYTGRTSKAAYDSSKAFTGSVVEHTYGLQTNPVEQTTSSQPPKPVSRFKMQKGGR